MSEKLRTMTCPQCHRRFSFPANQASRRRFCSKGCARMQLQKRGREDMVEVRVTLTNVLYE